MDLSDPITQDLVAMIQTQRLDLESLEQEAKAARQDGLVTDTDLAFEIFREELAHLEAQLLDRSLSLRVGQALDDEPQELSEAVSRNRAELQASQVRKQALKRTIVAKQCVICEDRYDPEDLTNGPCGHDYCINCLANLFKASVRDESIFPPRCCGQPFSVEEIRPVLSEDLMKEFDTKRVEFETIDRTYCHVPTCSAFINPNSMKGYVAACPQCQETTCIRCKGKFHEGVCADSDGAEEVLRLAEEKGWQQCGACKAVIELNTDCYHISKFTLPIVLRDSGLIPVFF